MIKINNKRRHLLLSLIMACVTVITTGTAIIVLYVKAVEEQKEQLLEKLDVYTRLIEVMYKDEVKHHVNRDPVQATIEQIVIAHKHYKGFGRTGEFALARLENNDIIFLIHPRHGSIKERDRIDFDSPVAAPMKLALKNKTGIMIGNDDRGVRVIAAYRKIDALNIGIVAKIDYKEIMTPFLQTIQYISLILVVLVLIGSYLFLKTITPLITFLRNSESQNREILEYVNHILDSLPISVSVTDTDGNITFTNKKWNDFSEKNGGTIKSTGVGSNYYSICEKAGEEKVLDGLHAVMNREADVFIWEYPCATPEEEFWFLLWASQLKTGGLVVSHLDVTRRKKSEEEIKNAKLRLESIFNAVPGVLMVMDNDLNIENHNCGGEGFSINGTYKCFETLAKKDKPCPDCPVWESFRTGNKVSKEVEYPGGITREVHTAPIPSSDGSVTSVVVHMRDISKQKKIEKELEVGLSFLKTLLDTIPSPIFYKNTRGQYMGCNQAFAELFLKAPKESIIGKTIHDLNLKGIRQLAQAVDKEDMDVLEKKQVHNFEREIHFADDKKRVFHFIKAVFRNSDREIAGIICVMVDITERIIAERKMKQAYREIEKRIKSATAELRDRNRELEIAGEKAESAVRAKSAFLANMSHEIRTPMNAIMGFIHLCFKTKMTDQQQDYLEKINGSALALLGIVNDILDFSKIEAGKLSMEKSAFTLDEVMTSISDMIAAKAEEKGLEVVFDIHSQSGLPLIGDPMRLSQVLTNLLSNAVKFTEKGEVVVRVEIEEMLKDKIRLIFSVKDTGIGLKTHQINTLFRAFNQADVSTTRKFGGTGLGLAISRRLVQMMNGYIWVESKPGAGSTFYFTAEFGIKKIDAETPVLPENIRRLKVLIVDDNEASLEVTTAILERLDFKTVSTDSAEKALSIMADAKEPFQLVITDWQMPKTDGIELIRRIKVSKDVPQPKIILMTAYGKEEVLVKGRQIGLDGFVFKPISRSSLYNAVLDVFQLSFVKTHEASDIADPVGLHKIAGAFVLVVEDNHLNRQVARELLENNGMNVSIVENGEKAVENVRSFDYDLVFMDIQMPVMDGLTATRNIRKLGGKYKDLPIVAMTAHALTGDADKSIAAGMNDHITKPINPVQLMETLLKWIKPDIDGRFIIPRPKAKYAELPENPEGIDMERGLLQTGGNKRLYLELLHEFYNDNKHIISSINNALKTKDIDFVVRTVHTLKSTAGNIGATELQKAATELDAAHKEGVFDDMQLLDALDSEMTVVLNTLNALPETRLPETKDVTVDMDILKEKIKELSEYLVDFDTSAEKTFREIEDMLNVAAPKHTERLKKQLKAFDLDNGLETVQMIANDIGIQI